MQRIVITKPFDVQIEETQIPEINKDNLILIRTEYSGVSLGTEKVYFDGTWEQNLSKYPIYPGYEAVGIVEKVGDNVKNINIGDRVVTFGNHAGYVIVPEGSGCQKVPNHIKPEKSTLAILGATAIHAVERGDLQPNSKVAIFGAGVLGLLLLQHAKLAGAGFVMVSDVIDEKLAIATALGADLVVNPKHKSPSEIFKNIAGELADVSYEVAGGAAKAQEEALRSTKEHGKVLLMGGGDKGVVRFPYRLFFSNELTIMASRATGKPENFEKSLARIINRQINVDAIPTKIVPYTDIAQIYDMLIRGNYPFIHLVLKWS